MVAIYLTSVCTSVLTTDKQYGTYFVFDDVQLHIGISLIHNDGVTIACDCKQAAVKNATFFYAKNLIKSVYPPCLPFKYKLDTMQPGYMTDDLVLTL